MVRKYEKIQHYSSEVVTVNVAATVRREAEGSRCKREYDAGNRNWNRSVVSERTRQSSLILERVK